MKNRGFIKTGKIIFLVSLGFFITYNSIYGWNTKPIDSTEEKLDEIYGLLLLMSTICFLVPAVRIYKLIIDILEENEIK